MTSQGYSAERVKNQVKIKTQSGPQGLLPKPTASEQLESYYKGSQS